MGLFNLGKTLSPRNSDSEDASDSKDAVALYLRRRPIRLRLNNELVSRLSRDVLDEGAKKLGLLRRGMFVFDSEEEMSVLMDYCIYDVYRNGRNAVEQYLCDCPPDPDSDEMACLHAMQHATYALAVVLRIQRGVGCHVRNMFTEETRLLVDMGLSKTAKPGTVMATRLMDFGGYIATGGASLPVGILDDDQLEEWQQTFRTVADEDRFDPAPLIRECLERGASSRIRHEDIATGFDFELEGSSRPTAAIAKQRRSAEKRRLGKPVANRRCRCGSGKMFKNCCGKC